MSEAIIDKIRKLFALAEDKGASEHEASTAMSMAMALMAKYNIEQTQLAEKAAGGRKLLGSQVSYDEFWHVDCMSAACELYHVHFVMLGGTASKYSTFNVIGHDVNVEAAKLTFQYLAREVERLYKVALPRGLSKSDRANFRRTFKHACAVRIRTRAVELMRELMTNDKVAQSATGSTALVVASQAKQDLEESRELMLKIYPNLREKLSRGRSGGLGTSAGLAAGNQVNLSRQIGNSNSTKMIGAR